MAEHDRTAEVVVVGLGVVGAATLWRLAARGVDVVGLEQFTVGHPWGSSHGSTRMFRTTCLEHPGLVPLARLSRRLWRELEAEAAQPLLAETGGLLIGPPGCRLVAGTLEAARVHDVAVEVLAAPAIARRFPEHGGVPDDHIAVLDSTAGMLRAEDAVRAAAGAAGRAGAEVRTGAAVTGIELVDGGVVVTTGTGTIRARQAVVTAGPWLPQLVPELPLTVVRTPMTWFRPAAGAGRFGVEEFPIFLRDLGGAGIVYGHGTRDGGLVKFALEYDDDAAVFRETSAGDCDRRIADQDWKRIEAIARWAAPGLVIEPAETTVCMYTLTPDHQFLVGRPHGDPRLVLGGGDSGHAFKHAPGLGEVLADTVLGRPPAVALDFADPDRFDGAF
ncbi:N-methyl-L-tryptophan oxidase [Amycolatopsis lexingtonensis]|uniref:N-methyl-L-tryptophan oxidase n=1 Tax=Amycolatopsis lexingtonensis TaxID=218822 RepID=UPI003F70D74F